MVLQARKKLQKPKLQIGLGCIYDVMNCMILEVTVMSEIYEMRLAEKQMERILPETMITFIIIMDKAILLRQRLYI